MEEWSIPGTESEGEGCGEETSLDFGGIKIPPHKLLELMQVVQQRRTVDLDCLDDTYQKKKHKKKKKKRKKRVGGADASETASEIRSTTCTSTTECRDARRSKLDLAFDPELDDYNSTAASKPLLSTRKKAPPLTHKKVGHLASLDKITADMVKRRQQWQRTEEGSRETSFGHAVWDGQTGDRDGFLESRGETMEVDGESLARNIMAEDSEKESDSDSDMKVSLMSQLNKVEQLLDFEVS